MEPISDMDVRSPDQHENNMSELPHAEKYSGAIKEAGDEQYSGANKEAGDEQSQRGQQLAIAEQFNEDTAKALLEGKDAINAKHIEYSLRYLTIDMTIQLLSSDRLQCTKEEMVELLKVALETDRNIDVCQILIENADDNDFKIAQKATRKCSYQVDVDPDRWGQLLHRAINGGNCKAVRTLLEHGIEVTAEHLEQGIVLPSCMKDMTRLLLEPPYARLHLIEEEELQELIHTAIKKWNEHACSVLIQHGVKVTFYALLDLILFAPRRLRRHFNNAPNLIQVTQEQEGILLRTAINCRYIPMCNMMINRGVNVDQVGKLHSPIPVNIDPISTEDHSPLYLAVRLNSLTMTRILVEAGAGVSVVDMHGPVLCIAQGNHLKQYLISSGSDLMLCARHYIDTTRQGITNQYTQALLQEQRDYLSSIIEGVPKLLHLCRVAVRQHIRDRHFRSLVLSLPLPQVMKDYLLYSDYPIEGVGQLEEDWEEGQEEGGEEGRGAAGWREESETGSSSDEEEGSDVIIMCPGNPYDDEESETSSEDTSD